MRCWGRFFHRYGWPRRRDGRDVQVCSDCGREKVCRIQFEGAEPERGEAVLEAREVTA